MGRLNATDSLSPRGGGESRSDRGHRAVRPLGVLSLVLGLSAALAPGAAPAARLSGGAARSWKIEPTPNAFGAAINALTSVACVSSQACTAVGSFAHSFSTPERPLAERWEGGQWNIQSTPLPNGATSAGFFGVSCPAATHVCMAAGDAFYTAGRRNTTLTEVWNGARWRVVGSPTVNPVSSLFAVSCPTAGSCTAVGSYENSAGRPQAIVETWNGASWHVQAVPRPTRTTQLLGVSCSGARACSAVGYEQYATGNARPLAESWNGAKWQVRPVPLPYGSKGGSFSAVSCPSSSACMATGTNFDPSHPTLAEKWNGSAWHIELTPSPADSWESFGEVALDAVSCTSAQACAAAGEYTPNNRPEYFLESWDGIKWRLDEPPHPSDFVFGTLLGMSCVSASCTAAGAYTNKSGRQVTLAMAG